MFFDALCSFFCCFFLSKFNKINKSQCGCFYYFFCLFVVCFKNASNSWRLSSRMENLMVVYSGASAGPSHLFQLLMRRCGIYCNLRSINSYLFRLSLRWDHRRTYSLTNTRWNSEQASINRISGFACEMSEGSKVTGGLWPWYLSGFNSGWKGTNSEKANAKDCSHHLRLRSVTPICSSFGFSV